MAYASGSGLLGLGLVLLVPWILRLVKRWTAWIDRPYFKPSPGPLDSVAGLERQLDRITPLQLQSDFEHAAATLTAIEPRIEQLQGPTGDRLRARLELAAGAFFAATSQPDPAKLRFRKALSLIAGMADHPLVTELKALANAGLGLLAASSTEEPELMQAGQRALENEAKVQRPEVLMRLVWVAYHLGAIEHREGRWPTGRELFERCTAIARRLSLPEGAGVAPESELTLYTSHARQVGSLAARNLGAVFVSLGDRERAMHWLDQAIELVEGAPATVARLRLAQALTDRVMNEPVDAFTGIGSHDGRLERAIEIGLDCGDQVGVEIACRAQAARASLCARLGMMDQAIEHQRRAIELGAGIEEPAHSARLAILQGELATLLESTGNRAGALAASEAAVKHGRNHPDPDTRLCAAQVAYWLHRVHIDADRVSEAREWMETIEQLVPTLPAPARPTFVVIAAHERGIQLMSEKHFDEARAEFDRVESLARESSNAYFMRAVAADRGRLELRDGRPAEAEPHLRRALDTPVPEEDPAHRLTRVAKIHWVLAHALMQMDRPEEAERQSRNAWELGRNAGDAEGREVAAAAALHLARASVEADDRRRYLESAAHLGRLCGSASGREMADAADALLRDPTSE